MVAFDGYNGQGWTDAGASIWGFAAENFTPSSCGSLLGFFTTPVSTSTRILQLRLENDGLLRVINSDVFTESSDHGIILKSTNGNCWRVTVDDNGNLIRTAITCP